MYLEANLVGSQLCWTARHLIVRKDEQTMRWKPYSVETQTVIPSPTCRKHETLQMRALISAQHFRSRRYKRPWWRMLLKCGWKLVQDSSNIWMLLPVSSTYGTVGSGSWHLLIIWSSQTCNLMLNRSQSHLPPIQCHPVPLISLTLPRPIIFSTTINLYQSFKKSKHIPPSFVTNTYKYCQPFKKKLPRERGR